MTNTSAPHDRDVPLQLYDTAVHRDWIDYNGHMSEAFYVLVAGFATDALLEAIGMDAPFRERTGHSLYTLEAHITYVREIREGEPIRVLTRVLDVDHQRVHLLHDLRHGAHGHRIAAEELVACNVDAAKGRAAPLLEPVAERLQVLRRDHQQLPPEDILGRSIGLRR